MSLALYLPRVRSSELLGIAIHFLDDPTRSTGVIAINEQMMVLLFNRINCGRCVLYRPLVGIGQQSLEVRQGILSKRICLKSTSAISDHS